MKNISIIIIFILFIFNKNNIIISCIESLNIWKTTLFPIIFPSLMLSDYILSSNLIYKIIKPFNKITNKIFKTSSYYLYILFISIIASTPTNIKNLYILYKDNSIDNNELNKIMASSIIFNPIFIIKFTNIKIYIIILISNILTLLINRNKYISYNKEIRPIDYKYNLNESISNNTTIILNILGTITLFMCLSSIFKTSNIYLNILISGTLELTTGLNKISLFINDQYIKDILSIIIISFGGISILYQIKSILKDTFINIKYYYLNRLLVCIISIIIYCKLS